MHLVGDLVMGLNAKNKKFVFHPRANVNGDFLQITHDKADGNWDWGKGITLRRGGNVGIGTPSPKAKLDVRGAIYAGNSDLYFTKTDHDHTGTGNTEGYAAIENAKNYDALMILGRAGTSVGRRVQIWDCLEVKGKFVNSSDLRAKKDIESVKYGLEAVKKLTPSSYNWKSTPNPHKSLGLIAQEVQPIIPEVVYKDEEGQMSIAYLDLIPVLINALKEIDGKIERLATPAPVRP